MSGISQFYNRYTLDDSLIRKVGFNPYYHLIGGYVNEKLMVKGEAYIDLATNNYLAIANHPEIVEACCDALSNYGVSMCSTPIAGGNTLLYKETCQQLADFAGLESALVYPSCYQANNGLLSVVANKNDIILIDQYAHSSLIEGAKAVGCKLRPFKHNDMHSLEKNLANCPSGCQLFVVSESVFSTEGSICPLEGIISLAEKYDAITIVDDSHGIGVIGEQGRGILEHARIKDYNGIYTASLGKAFANSGGVVAGKSSLMNYLKYYSSHLVYSTAVPPQILAGILATIRIVKTEFSTIKKQMMEVLHSLRGHFEKAGFNLSNGLAPIISVKAGSAEETMALARCFYEEKIITTPFVYPSVPKNKGVVRIIAGNKLNEGTLEKVIEAVYKIGNKLNKQDSI